ncbi:peptidase S8 [Streptomyces agglomeratus]|uniref:S8 family peptidase n=1 Tax=Streptomyces agglomeratus TaxID=285458 RepID=UPI0008540773|nr:S8 family serine peptidase [Streptomyces agglomeratus]OEJ38405.1 peptidase S8 [Streptomyces agglomeratus]OEJ47210.1 peptidase S8 [Streptomyces agglomeratus]OEJ50933.1 peptidase S8 [Streptomyces agglomeratus]OEJ58303.1 peptidase S8 [Streptomyces agglomeratus]
MAHLGSRRQRTLALPVGLALTATLGFLPGAAASAAPQDGPAAPAAVTADGPKMSYVVNTKGGHAASASVKRAIARAGGTVVKAYDQIGVIVVHSQNPDFGKQIRKAEGVSSAGATRTSPLTPVGITEEGATQKLTAAQAAKAEAAAAPGQEPLEANQWDIRAIGADKAAQVNDGSSRVTVGVIDTGVDDTHPDLAPNFSKSQSANCVGGVADSSEGAWRPYTDGSDHGTHVAGTIAAPRNGLGVAGVAPGVKLAGIKVSEPGTSLFFTEAVVCGFVWAAEHDIDVTNNSYYVDPWKFNCKDDPDQKALLDSLTRAMKYAERKGALHVAAAGNSNFDLAADAIVDDSSPNDSTPVERVIDPSECPDAPTMLPGVVAVTSTGDKNVKSYYSSYGHGVADVSAPGGDKWQIPATPDANGRVLSTVLNGGYGYKQGTSMATPHVAGVAALLKSAHPKASPADLRRLLKKQADNPGCPTHIYDAAGNWVEATTCEGDENYNGYYGSGVVDALDAVKK